MVQDGIKFVEEMKKNERYLVEFDNVGNVLEKSYPEGCKLGEQKRPIILITHDESTFAANDAKKQAWLQEGDTFLQPKEKGQGIMVSDFLLPWGRLNLNHLNKEKIAEGDS